MIYNALNIKKDVVTFKYVVGVSEKSYQIEAKVGYILDENTRKVYFVNKFYNNLRIEKNYWASLDGEVKYDYLPQHSTLSDASIFIPQLRVEKLEKDVKYACSFSTWIGGWEIVLGSYLMDINDANAIDEGVKVFNNEKYYENIEFPIMNALSIIYDESWKDFREKVCGAQDNINNIGSNINVCFTPIQKSKIIDQYITLPSYMGSQSTLFLYDSNMASSLVCDISTNEKVENEIPQVNAILSFNRAYRQNNEGFKKYLLETYFYMYANNPQFNIDNFHLEYKLVLYDKNNIYRYVEHKMEDLTIQTKFNKYELELSDWSTWKEGLKLQVWVFLKNNDSEDELLFFKSNEVILDMEKFKYFVSSCKYNNVKLNEIDMVTYNISTCNKIVNNIVKVSTPNDGSNKTLVQKPIFVRVQDTNSINIHPQVNENIVINLDAYKNKVEVFQIKIGTTNFMEVGRINSGVIFAINGVKLAKDLAKNGTYYVLDGEGTLVTKGQYTIISK